jgi:V/A-type H+-transporting ATPase subunit D
LKHKLRVIGRTISATSRKINALEEIIAPEIKAEISGIRNYFEEIAREDIFRIKRYKKLKTKNR